VVPVLEAEMLMDNGQTLERCDEVAGHVLHSLFKALFEQRASLDTILVSPSIVTPATGSTAPEATERVALATLRCLKRHVPASVPGIALLSGEQSHLTATLHLNAINQLGTPTPWAVSFSYGRALQEEALHRWQGRSETITSGQRAFYRRAKCLSAAALGRYSRTMESDAAVA
jgi:fructose-bisphosphate aldolase class I